jgi:hypothetical protein
MRTAGDPQRSGKATDLGHESKQKNRVFVPNKFLPSQHEGQQFPCRCAKTCSYLRADKELASAKVSGANRIRKNDPEEGTEFPGRTHQLG